MQSASSLSHRRTPSEIAQAQKIAQAQGIDLFNVSNHQLVDTPYVPHKNTGSAAKKDLLVSAGAHQRWLSQGFIPCIAAPESWIAPGARKSPVPLINSFRSLVNTGPSDSQMLINSKHRLLRDGLLATIQFYGLDAEKYGIPEDKWMLYPTKAAVEANLKRSMTYMSKDIIPLEFPNSVRLDESCRPTGRVGVGIYDKSQLGSEGMSQQVAEEIFVKFEQPGSPGQTPTHLFYTPIVATRAYKVWNSVRELNVSVGSLPATFKLRGHMPFSRTDVGVFSPLD